MNVFFKSGLPRLLAIAVLLLCALPSWAQSPYKPALWEVRSGNASVHLFGTIHVGNPDFYPLPKNILAAFNQSDVLALEIDPADNQEMMTAMMSAMYTPPDNVSNHISPDLLANVRKVATAYGIQFNQIQQMKPYLLMFSLTSLEYARLGYDASSGIDQHLSQRARAAGKKIVALESMIQQMQMLDGLSAALQTAMLGVTVEEILNDDVSGLVADMITAWRSGDTQKLDVVLRTEERRLPAPLADEFHNRFLTERNVTMTEKIERMLSAGQNVFVAVGALHMVGEDSIPALLMKNGYKVKRLQ